MLGSSQADANPEGFPIWRAEESELVLSAEFDWFIQTVSF